MSFLYSSQTRLPFFIQYILWIVNFGYILGWLLHFFYDDTWFSGIYFEQSFFFWLQLIIQGLYYIRALCLHFSPEIFNFED
jgi:uncharacterized membrane protein SpoIIM required for sporulation